MSRKVMSCRCPNVSGWVAVTLAVFFVLMSAPLCAAERPTATAVITDRAALAASNQFATVNQFRLAGTGDVFFTSGGNSALFRWGQAAGAPERLLQTNDPLEKLGIPDLPEDYAGFLLDTTGSLLQANAPGHAAFVTSVAFPGEQDPAGVVVYDGSSYRLVEMGLDTYTQLFLNASGMVAARGVSGSMGMGPARIYVETVSGEVKLVADQMLPAPAPVGGTIGGLQLIGFNDAGKVAFLATNIQGGSDGAQWAVFLSDGTTASLVVKGGQVAPGAGGNFYQVNPSVSNFILNNLGKIAFLSGTTAGKNGIWIGDDSGAQPVKLVLQGEPVGIDPPGGNYGSIYSIRGFNDLGQVLFEPNQNSTNYALFLKYLANPAQVVFYRGQSGGPGDTFYQTVQATLNNNGKVALLARSSSNGYGWYLGSGTAAPLAIAVQGDTSPLGGKFGFAGKNVAASLNASDQVLFLSDVLDLNAVALLRWTPGSGLQTVVSTNDSLPAGAMTVLRFPGVASDNETMAAIFKAGGKRAFYAKQLRPGMGGLRRIVGEFDPAPNGGVIPNLGMFAMNGKGEVVVNTPLLRPSSGVYPDNGILASLPGAGLVEVASSATPVPGLPNKNFTLSFGPPQINNQSQAAFYATTYDFVTSTNGAGIFLVSEAAYVHVAHTGDTWPGLGGGTIGGFNSSLSLNDSGQVAFQANKSVPSGSWPGLFVGTADAGPLKVVERGDSAASGTISGIQLPFKLNANGQLAFMAYYEPPIGGSGIFLGAGGETPQAIATTGADAPGTGGKFAFFNSNAFHLNSAGQVAFWAGLSCCYGNGWFLGSDPDNLAARLLQNQALPGGGFAGSLPPGNRSMALANSGEMAIYVPDTRETEIQPQLVIAGADGTLRKFAGNGQKAEGTGSEFGKLFPMLIATPSGNFLFSAVLVDGPAKAGIFQSKP